MKVGKQEFRSRSLGALLGGRVAYAQLTTGYRTGIEPVLLAAATPAAPGDSVLEAGCGAGAALLCLLHRVPTATGHGIEIDPALTALARDNAAANAAAMQVTNADFLSHPIPTCDHAIANPPWHDPAGTQSPDPARRRALHGDGIAWIAPLAATARATLTLALPAAAAGAALAALQAAGLRQTTLFPLWPREGADARLILLQARRGPVRTRLATGLVLHGADGRFTQAADAVLRHAEPLDLAPSR